MIHSNNFPCPRCGKITLYDLTFHETPIRQGTKIKKRFYIECNCSVCGRHINPDYIEAINYILTKEANYLET